MTATEAISAQPLYEHANRTLDSIYQDLVIRAQTIEGEMKRLAEELGSVNAVLSRIAPPAPTPLGGYAHGNAVPSASVPPNTWR